MAAILSGPQCDKWPLGYFNPLCAELFEKTIQIYSHFPSFLNTKMFQVGKIRQHGKLGPVCLM